MSERKKRRSLVFVSLLLLSGYILASAGTGKALTAIAQNRPIVSRRIVIIDAGHGGEDGGAVSCTGAFESDINLAIALKLNDLMHLLGTKTVMIRTTDCSVYTQGTTISQKKVSDLKERVRIVNHTQNALLISIHQNFFLKVSIMGHRSFTGKGTTAGFLPREYRKAL